MPENDNQPTPAPQPVSSTDVTPAPVAQTPTPPERATYIAPAMEVRNNSRDIEIKSTPQSDRKE